MSSEPTSEPNNVTPLSHARLNRKSNNPNNSTIEIAEDRLRDILSSVVDEQVTQKITRLENSVNRMIGQFEAVRIGKAEDAALRVTTNLDNTDIALSGINLPKEEFYPYTCGYLAEVLRVRRYDVTKTIKELGLRDDPKYHISISTGQTSKISKWSEAALQKLRETLEPKQ